MLNGSEPVLPAPRLADNVVRRRRDAIERAGDRDVVDQGFEREDARHDPCIAARACVETATTSTGHPRDGPCSRTRTTRSSSTSTASCTAEPRSFPAPRRPSPACARRASAWRSSRTTRPGRRRPWRPVSRGSASRPRPTKSRRSALVTAAQLAARGVSEAFVVGEEGILAGIAGQGHRDRRRRRGIDRGRRRRMGSPGGLREAPPGVAPGAAWREPGGDERRRLVPGNRRELARRRGAARRHRNDDRRASRGVRQAGGAHHARRARARREAERRSSSAIGSRRTSPRAAALGWDSLLVLTGIASVDDVAASPTAPTFVAEDLSALFAPPRAEGSSAPGVCWPRRPAATEGDPMVTTLEEIRKTIEARDRQPDPGEGPGAGEEPLRPGYGEGAGGQDGGRHARVVAAEPRAFEGVHLAGDRLTDEVDGRRDAGRSGRREEAGPRPGATRRHDRVRRRSAAKKTPQRRRTAAKKTAAAKPATTRRHRRDRPRAPSAARRGARPARIGEQPGRGAGGRGGRAGDRRREPRHEGRIARRGRRPRAGARAPPGVSCPAAARSSERRSIGSASTRAAAIASTPARRRVGSRIACCRRAPRAWSPSTSGTASWRGRCATTPASR